MVVKIYKNSYQGEPEGGDDDEILAEYDRETASQN